MVPEFVNYWEYSCSYYWAKGIVLITGLYHDGRLSVFRNIRGQQAEKHRPNEETNYIHVESNLPLISRSIENELSYYSWTKELSEKLKDYYKHLQQCEYNYTELHRRKQNKSKISEVQHTLVQPTLSKSLVYFFFA